MSSRLWWFIQSSKGMATVILITGVLLTTLSVSGLIKDQFFRSQIPRVLEDDPASTYNGRRPHDQGATLSDIERRFKKRRNYLKKVCSRPEYREKDPSVFFHEDRYMLVAYERLRWCRIAKVGTTFMKETFSPSRLQLLNQTDQTPVNLSKYPKRFFFVRDPYSRLVSGYLDKVVASASFWPYFGRHAIRIQRYNATQSEIECGSDVTFNEFIKYIIMAEKINRTRNKHFLPMHDLCDVCNRDYDFIGHLETIREDLPFIVNSVGFKMDMSQNFTDIIARKIQEVFVESRSRVEKCVGIYPMMKRLWWTFQVRGLISDTISLPASQGQVETASWEQLASWIAKAYHDTKALGSRSAQKRTFRADLFRGVPLHLRLKYLELYSRDFQLFQYDPLQSDIFPELDSVIHEH